MPWRILWPLLVAGPSPALKGHTTLEELHAEERCPVEWVGVQMRHHQAAVAAMEAAIESDKNESDAKAEAARPVADKLGQPDRKGVPFEANAKSFLQSQRVQLRDQPLK